MTMQQLTTDGVAVPRFLYGTAWKEDDTERLVRLALAAGFRGIDTANQRKHYFEAAVGAAVQKAIADGVVTRESLFLQTKYTFQAGQDHRLPYDPKAPTARQVEQSFASSLEHLQVDRIDSYVLHGPSQRSGLGAVDFEAWRAMEAIYDSGSVRFLGVSNVSHDQLQLLCQKARILPRFVQNRCYASQQWDKRIRDICTAHNFVYQGFSLLTANRDVAALPSMKKIAQKHGKDFAQIIFRFALDVGMLPLTGTTDEKHMKTDLAVFDFRLDPDEIMTIEQIAAR